MSAPIPEDKLADIKTELFAGRKIAAIKLYRAATGAGLAEAKAAVDTLETELRARSPEEFVRTPENRGCLGLLLAAVVVLISIVMWRLNHS